MTVMEEVLMKGFSDRGSNPLRSIRMNRKEKENANRVFSFSFYYFQKNLLLESYDILKAIYRRIYFERKITMKKKMLLLILIGAMAITMTACDGTNIQRAAYELTHDQEEPEVDIDDELETDYEYESEEDEKPEKRDKREDEEITEEVTESDWDDDVLAEEREYQEIYLNYSDKMEERTPELVDEFWDETDGIENDNDALADLCDDKITVLSEIDIEGESKMYDLMEANGDDYEVYEKWSSKLNDVYMNQSSALSDAYNSFQ